MPRTPGKLPGRVADPVIALVGMGGLFAAGAAATAPEVSFAASMRSAMSRMMADMVVKPSGDTDRDFVAMMVPHHQAAIDMAVAELRFGKDPTLKRIAREIIVDQQQEIVAMRMAVGQAPPLSSSAPTGSHPAHGNH